VRRRLIFASLLLSADLVLRIPAAAAALDELPAAARRALVALYPGYDAATRLTGESFRSSSLQRETSDVTLRDFAIAQVPGTSRQAAAALLKPVGFPASYTLLEVAVVHEAADGVVSLLKNLKVRVDSGSGSGEVRMKLARAAAHDKGLTTFDVIVEEEGESLRHRFRHERDRLLLVGSAPMP
jgi:hypothetical protein